MLTRTFAFEVADKGIRVNGIAPDAISIDMNKGVLADEKNKNKRSIKFR